MKNVFDQFKKRGKFRSSNIFEHEEERNIKK